MKKNKIELDIDAYLAGIKKTKKPSTLTMIVAGVLAWWTIALGVTAFVVLTKLMIEGWKWIL